MPYTLGLNRNGPRWTPTGPWVLLPCCDRDGSRAGSPWWSRSPAWGWSRKEPWPRSRWCRTSFRGRGHPVPSHGRPGGRLQDEGDGGFGLRLWLRGAWVLAPQRDGPHNWEDVGLRSATRALEVLGNHFPADLGRVVVHGHSRGGHGAWALATRRGLPVASACGWYSREEYGDANNLWAGWVGVARVRL